MEKGPPRRGFRNIFFWLSIIGPGIITANVDMMLEVNFAEDNGLSLPMQY
jgi:hypothetical protein